MTLCSLAQQADEEHVIHPGFKEVNTLKIPYFISSAVISDLLTAIRLPVRNIN